MSEVKERFPDQGRTINNPKTREVGRYIYTYMRDHGGMAPTIREIGKAVTGSWSDKPASPSIVWSHLRVLEDVGIIRTHHLGRSRGISIVGSYFSVPNIPEALIEDYKE